MSQGKKGEVLLDHIKSLYIEDFDEAGFQSLIDSSEFGTDDEKYAMAIVLLQFTTDPNAIAIIQPTEDIVNTSQREAFELFEDTANNSYPAGMIMTAYVHLHGIGTDPDIDKAEEWTGKASIMLGSHPMIDELKAQIAKKRNPTEPSSDGPSANIGGPTAPAPVFM